jgi:TRAP-type C4-dicarboxylate transport system permease small subunit
MMRPLYVRLMDKLYLACVVVGVISVVCMVALIFTGVVMRYLFDMGARFAEPMSIFFTVQLTMYGAAACYRVHGHLRLQVFVKMLPQKLQAVPDYTVQLLMGVIAVLMIYYGASLTETTWFQSYPEFEYVKVGLVYSAIPGSGVILLMFVIEALFFPHVVAEVDEEELARTIEHAEAEERRLAEESSVGDRG